MTLAFIDAHRTVSSTGPDAVRVKLFPFSSYEWLPRRAASLLFKRLQRYNWCLEDPANFRSRWGSFWPSLSPVQRQVLALFVMRNCGGIFGRRLEAAVVPIEFEHLDGVESLMPRPEDEQKFRQLLTAYFAHLVTPDDVAKRWERDHAEVVQKSVRDDFNALLFSAEVGLHADRFVVSASSLRKDWTVAYNTAIAKRLAASVTALMGEKEQQLWSNF